MTHRTVGELMTKNVTYMPGETPVVEAARAMRERQIGDVLVTDDGQTTGVVTDRDIVVRAVAADMDPASTPLRQIASTNLLTIDQDAAPADAAQLMREQAVRRLVVTKGDGTLVGILSIGDLAAALDPGSALGDISRAAPNN